MDILTPAPALVEGGRAGGGATQTDRPDRARRLLAIALLVGLLAGWQIVARSDVGAMPDSIGCTIGALSGAGTAFLLVAAPPVGTFQVIVTGTLGLGTLAGIVDACGAWLTVDLANRLNIFGPCQSRCVPNSGGGSW